jgi:tetratricopeptide (TPR) repeat protein
MLVSSFRAVPFAVLFLVSIPASSQTLVQLDALSDETADEKTGIALASKQTERGELLEALATIERVLARFPGSAEARFNHAMLLCSIGDPQGALIEFDRLKDKDYPVAALKQAIANCRIADGERRP